MKHAVGQGQGAHLHRPGLPAGPPPRARATIGHPSQCSGGQQAGRQERGLGDPLRGAQRELAGRPPTRQKRSGDSDTVTFLLIQRRQDAVVPADLEVDLLLHTLRDGPLRDDDAHAGLYGAQHAAVAVEHASGCGHHRVAVLVVILLHR